LASGSPDEPSLRDGLKRRLHLPRCSGIRTEEKAGGMIREIVEAINGRIA
jgi:hypothetical protein